MKQNNFPSFQSRKKAEGDDKAAVVLALSKVGKVCNLILAQIELLGTTAVVPHYTVSSVHGVAAHDVCRHGYDVVKSSSR